MSAPDTNIDKQKKRHKGPLGGIALALIFAGILFVGYVAFEILAGDAPEGAETQVDGRTGEVTESE